MRWQRGRAGLNTLPGYGSRRGEWSVALGKLRQRKRREWAFLRGPELFGCQDGIILELVRAALLSRRHIESRVEVRHDRRERSERKWTRRGISHAIRNSQLVGYR